MARADLLRAIHSSATRRGLMLVLSGIDLNPRSAIEAVAATPTGTVIAWETGDVFDQAPEPKPDFVVSSQFAHHLTDDQVVAFLLWLERDIAIVRLSHTLGTPPAIVGFERNKKLVRITHQTYCTAHDRRQRGRTAFWARPCAPPVKPG